MTRFLTSAPVQRLGAGAGLIMTIAGAYMFADQLVKQLDVIADMKDKGEKKKALHKLIRFAALTGLMLFVAAKSDFIMVRGGAKVGLHSSVKAEYQTRQKVSSYNRQIRRTLSGHTLVSIVPIPIFQYAKVIFLELRKAAAKLSTLKDRAAVKALKLSDDELEEAYRLARKVDDHLASKPDSIYHGREEELFGKLMEGKLKFNKNGTLVPGKKRPIAIKRVGDYGEFIKEIEIARLNKLHDAPKTTKPPGFIEEMEKKLQKEGWNLDEAIIVIDLPDGTLLVTNGHHRILAMENMGQKTIPVDILSVKDAKLLYGSEAFATLIEIGRQSGYYKGTFKPDVSDGMLERARDKARMFLETNFGTKK